MMGDSSEEDYHSAEENEATDVRGPPREDDTSLEERLKTVRLSEGLGAVAVGGEQGETTTKLEGNGSSKEQLTHQSVLEREEEEGDGRTRNSTNVAAVGGPQERTSEGDVGTKEGDHSRDQAAAEGCGDGAGEFISGIDNRYVSEDVTMKGDKVELTEEQVKELKEQANKLKTEGNANFKSGEYSRAVELYSEALKLYPPSSSCDHEIAVCYANRAACYVKTEEHQNVIDDCTKALDLEPNYLKAVVRRAQANEALEKYEEALEDYKKALELDPSQGVARYAITYLPEKIKEQQEKMKAEMLGKLKELGNALLQPFGLSTDNFQMQQDPNSGGYSINFKR